MDTPRERRVPPGWTLALTFGVATAAGLKGLIDAAGSSSSSGTGLVSLRLVCTAVMVLAGITGFVLIGRGHHDRKGYSPPPDDEQQGIHVLKLLVPSEDPAQRAHQSDYACSIIRTFPLTCCLLVLGSTSTLWACFLPDEPVFVRVIAGTAALICTLWLLGLLLARLRAGRFRRRTCLDDPAL